MYPCKVEGKIEDNYNEYLSKPIRVGFMFTFPIVEVLEEFKVKEICRGMEFDVTVQLCKNNFGVRMLVTSEVSIAKYLFMQGFASDCHYDEAATMERAIVAVCKLKNFMIYNKINSWPFAKADVGDNFYTD